MSTLLHNLQRIAHRLQQPPHLEQQKRHPRRRNAPHTRASPPPKEAAAATLPGRFNGSQRHGASFMFASATPRAPALAAQPSAAEGSQPRSAEPSNGRPEAAAAARVGEHDQLSTASTAGAAEPPGQDGDRAQAAGQAARGPQASPAAAQQQRSGAAGGEARPRLQRHWRWPREWALPHWPPPQLSGFVLPAWAAQAVGGKQKLLTVQQFFNYVENEGAPFIKCYSSSARQFPQRECVLTCMTPAWPNRLLVLYLALRHARCHRAVMHAQACYALACSCAHTQPLLHANFPSHAGRSFFDSLDRNGDGAVSLDDLRSAMRARKLPEEYAHQFLARARRGRWWVQRVRCGLRLGRRAFCPGSVPACLCVL